MKIVNAKAFISIRYKQCLPLALLNQFGSLCQHKMGKTRKTKEFGFGSQNKNQTVKIIISERRSIFIKMHNIFWLGKNKFVI